MFTAAGLGQLKWAAALHGTSTERPRIRTVAGRILYRTRRLPWERELFS
eukprot:COSAG01_NODE_58164_length_307_cov_3.014423_1_plen_48_part_10